MENKNERIELDYPQLLDADNNSKLLKYLFSSLTDGHGGDFSIFDRALKNIEESKIKLVEDEDCSLSLCLAFLAQNNQTERAIRLVNRSIVSVANEMQSYNILSGLMNMRSEENIDCVKQVINRLISKGINVDAETENSGETVSIIKYAASQFISSHKSSRDSQSYDSKVLAGDREILINIIESRSNKLSLEKKSLLKNKINQGRFELADLVNNELDISSENLIRPQPIDAGSQDEFEIAAEFRAVNKPSPKINREPSQDDECFPSRAIYEILFGRRGR